MKILKRLLMVLGAVFALIVVAVFFLAGRSSEFKSDNEGFVRQFVSDFSEQWRVRRVAPMMTNDLSAQFYTAKGQQSLTFYQSLGEVVEMTDVELGRFQSHTNGTSAGVFKLKAQFENGFALVEIVVHVREGQQRVNSFGVFPIGEIAPSRDWQT